MLGKVTARTTATGTVTLSYLPEGETLVRIRRVGFEVTTMLVSISPDDTVPLTVLLPVDYNKTGSNSGVPLLWTRER